MAVQVAARKRDIKSITIVIQRVIVVSRNGGDRKDVAVERWQRDIFRVVQLCHTSSRRRFPSPCPRAAGGRLSPGGGAGERWEPCRVWSRSILRASASAPGCPPTPGVGRLKADAVRSLFWVAGSGFRRRAEPADFGAGFGSSAGGAHESCYQADPPHDVLAKGTERTGLSERDGSSEPIEASRRDDMVRD